MIEHALNQIGKHPHVDTVGPVEISPDGIYVASVPIRTNLPTAWRAAGKSPTGVQLVEQAVFQFPPDYPANPPRIYLRNDFNRSLPHIQPGDLEDPVEPCYLDGDPRELLYRQGIGAIVNQLVYWLERAAKDELIDREQGWEPIRRDSIDDYAVVEHSSLRQLVRKHAAFRFLPVEYVKFIGPVDAQRPGKGYLFYGSVLPEPVSVNRKSLGDLRVSQTASKGFQFGESIAIFATPGKLPSGDPYICDQYLPETVTNLSMLVQQAHRYGCGKELEDALTHLQRQTADIPTVTQSIPILVILCARRPTHLIGSSSDLELIPYLLETPAPMFTDDHAAIPVHPVALRHAISPQLLRDVSGINTPDDRILVQLGCGSLGSKIALHMARAGLAPSVVADNRTMSPHNAARHALVPSKERFNILWMVPKAEALADAINGLGQSAEAVNVDAVSLSANKKRLWKVIPKKAWAVVNATASLAVRDTLGTLSTAIMPARVIETSLFAGGSVGLMTIEGPNRNPNTSDLVLEAYEMIRSDESIRERFFGINGNLERQEIGQGCSSTTMIMPDTDISLFSASMARKLLEIKRVFGLVIDFGTSQSPKSTRPLTTYWCPSRPGHQALRNN
ncbi:ThiF family adenylyltransferase, partial [Thiolapillus sp.]|uniref:ThiF family adenylyltransferase n=1 Tax=Thiolapillus sp. TaxID=2017437 RepID=UPI0025EBB26C